MINLLNVYLSETRYRCFCATFDCSDNNPKKGIALFIYKRRIWPGSMLDRFLWFRRIVAVIRPVITIAPTEPTPPPEMVFARTFYSRGHMRHFWYEFREMFIQMFRVDICNQRRTFLSPGFKPLRVTPAPDHLLGWVQQNEATAD